MEHTDYIFGSRAALRIGIRRGDLPLARSAFSILWKTPEHRNWLKFRLPLIVAEDAYYLAPAYYDLCKKKDRIGEEKAYRLFIDLLTLVRKSKDVDALARLCRIPKNGDKQKHRELYSANRLMILSKVDDVGKLSTHILEHAMKETAPDPYLIKGLGTFFNQIKRGGRQADRKTLMIGMLLLNLRGVPERRIKEEIQSVSKRIDKPSKIVPLPWYCFLPWSHVGRRAELSLIKNNSIPVKDLHCMWIHNEFDYVSGLEKEKLTDKHRDCFNSMWWSYYLSKFKKLTKSWDSIKPKVQRGVTKELKSLRTKERH